MNTKYRGLLFIVVGALFFYGALSGIYSGEVGICRPQGGSPCLAIKKEEQYILYWIFLGLTLLGAVYSFLKGWKFLKKNEKSGSERNFL